MKRLLALWLAVAAALSLSACGALESLPSDPAWESFAPESSVSEELSGSPAGETSAPEKEPGSQAVEEPESSGEQRALPEEGGSYYDLENVVLYLELYGDLPDNFITKEEARALGWEGGSVERYREGAAIGGDRFGNREGLLAAGEGRSYTECDLDTDGRDSRGAKRLVFSNDGLYFYTEDHYGSFSEALVTEDYEVELQ